MNPRGIAGVRDLAAAAAIAPHTLRALARAGIVAPISPARLARMVVTPAHFGFGAATLCAATAARWPGQTAIVDESGSLAYGELADRGSRLAAALRDELGAGAGGSLAVMCRNHRGFVEALLAGSVLGGDLLLLNTDFPGPQLAQVLERERPTVAIHDAEFSDRFAEVGFEGERAIAWQDAGPSSADFPPTVGELIATASGPARGARRPARIVILTSGTTGTPKGAPRSPSPAAVLGPFTTLLERVPFRAREPMAVAPPFFHGFGLAYLGLAMALGATVITRRRFDAEAALAAIEERRVTSLAAVPVMLKRILDLPGEVRGRYDTSSLRVITSAAAPLSADLAAALADEFGEIVYNLYGTTESGFGALADPADMRAAPGTVGRAPRGVELKILGPDNRPALADTTGRIFLGTGMIADGFESGEDKEVVDGMLSTGDLGRLDSDGRLFVEGREDDMIVSGGENVFAGEVQDVLARHPAVADAAVIGVEDEDFGQRLRAFVVPDGNVEADELKAHVKTNLARYKVPRDIVFVDEVPRNPTGKIALKELRGLSV